MTALYLSSKKAVFAARLRTIRMSTTKTAEEEPWYKNQWVWLIIAIPSLTIVGCLFTIYLALSHPDHLVRDTPNEGETPAAQSR